MHNLKNTEVSFYRIKYKNFPKDGREISLREIIGHEFDLSEVILDESPVFTTKDIIEYSQNEHTIKLTKEAYKKFCALNGVGHFAICVDNKPVYLGLVWPPYLSTRFNGLSIETNDKCNEIQLTYPIEGLDDPRQNKLILDSLRKSNKLVETISEQKALEIAKKFFLGFNYGPIEEYKFSSKRECERWKISYTTHWKYKSKRYHGEITVNKITGETNHIWTGEIKYDDSFLKSD